MAALPPITPTSDVNTWTPEQVSTWVTEQGYQLIASHFTEQNINGTALLALVDADMKGAPFNLKIGDTKNFLIKVNALRQTPPDPQGDNTGAAISEWIKKTKIIGCTHKANYTVPHKVSSPQVKWNHIKRDDAVDAVFAFWTDRLISRTTAVSAIDRQSNPLTATHCAPGGGKSVLEDLLAGLIGTDKILEVVNRLCAKQAARMEAWDRPLQATQRTRAMKAAIADVGWTYDQPTMDAMKEVAKAAVEHLVGRYKEMGELLRKSVSIMITYNSGTPFSEVDRDAERGLALRVLFSFFFVQESSYSNFVAAFGDRPVTLQQALDCVQLSLPPKTGIFLGVDELIKAGGIDKDRKLVQRVLTALGTSLNGTDYLCGKEATQNGPFNVLVTTLDQEPLILEETESGRKINWVVLHRPSISEVLTLFPPEFVKNPLFRQCASACNGHYRSLEALWRVWNEAMIRCITPQYSDLMRQVAEKFPYPGTHLTREVVFAALKGSPVALSTKIGARTFSELIINGVCLNALSGQQSAAVPLLSPLLLHRWAIADKEPSDTQAKAVSSCILDMMALMPNFNWQQYEEFHGEWEVMKRVLHGGQEVNVLEFYTPAPSDDLRKSHMANSIPANSSFAVSPKTGVTKLPHHFSGCNMEDLAEVVCLPAQGNPGFDVASLEQTKSGQIGIFVECRFSQPGANTTISPSAVKRKRELTLENGVLPSERSILVVCAFRKLHSDWFKKQEDVPNTNKRSRVDDVEMSTNGETDDGEDSDSDLDDDEEFRDSHSVQRQPPRNTLVLDATALRKMYTESLVAVPHFMLELSC